MKKLIQIENDSNYVNGFYQACHSFADQLKYIGATADYASVVAQDVNVRNDTDILIISLDMYAVDIRTMCENLRNAYPKATIIGMISKNNPNYAQTEGIAMTYGCDAVLVKIPAYIQTVQDVLQKASKPVHEPYMNPTFVNVPTQVPTFHVFNEQASTTEMEFNRDALESPTGRKSPPAVLQQTIGISSSKGGVGKTTTATEIAEAFAMAKNNQFDGKLRVCIVDLDLDYGDVPTMLNVPSGKNIYTWVQDIDEKMKTAHSIDEIKYSFEYIEEKFIKMTNTGLYVLLPTISPFYSAKVREEHIKVIFRHLKQYFHIVVCDLGNNTRDFTLLALLESTDVILVTDIEKTAINSLKKMVEALKQMDFPTKRFNFILNKVENDVGLDKNEIIQAIQEKLEVRYIGELPYLKQVKKLHNQSETVMEYYAKKGEDNEFTIGIKKILSEISPIFKNAKTMSNKKIKQKAEKQSEGKSGGVFGFVKSFFGI